MHHSHRVSRWFLLPILVTASMIACGGSDGAQESVDTDPGDSAVSSDPAPAEEGSGAEPDATAVETCLEDAGLQVRNQDEIDTPYTAEQLEFFDLDTELLVEAGDAEFISGSIYFYRTVEKADAQELIFEESATDYTVGRAGTVVYTLVGGTAGGELDTVTDAIDRCLSEN